MNSFAPIFETILDSSIWEESYTLRVLWTAMLVLKDPDHVVRSSAFKIAKRANMKEQEVIDGLKKLSEPDPRRIEHQDYEGRRIEKVDGGWLILNGQKYEDEMRAVSRRMYKARKAREYREAQRQEPERRKAVGKLMRPGGARTMEERLIEKAEREGDSKTVEALERMRQLSPTEKRVKATADEFVAKFHKSMEAANAALAAASPEASPIDLSALRAERADFDGEVLAANHHPEKESTSDKGGVPAEGAEGQKFPEV